MVLGIGLKDPTFFIVTWYRISSPGTEGHERSKPLSWLFTIVSPSGIPPLDMIWLAVLFFPFPFLFLFLDTDFVCLFVFEEYIFFNLQLFFR